MGVFNLLKDLAKLKLATKLMRGSLGRAFLLAYVAKKGYKIYRNRRQRLVSYS